MSQNVDDFQLASDSILVVVVNQVWNFGFPKRQNLLAK